MPNYFARSYFATGYYAAGYWHPATAPEPTTRGGTGLPERRDDHDRFIRNQDDEAAAWLLLA